jgi:hypothetical protein
MAKVRTASLSLVVAAILAFAAPPAEAQDAEKARQLFQQGSKYYDLGQFDKAIEAWQQGYDQKPDPGFLYNIAQAYRQKQDATKAIFFYKGYLRNSPKAQNRVEVEKKIAELQKQLDTGAPPPPTTPPPTTPPPPGPPPPGPPPPTSTVTTTTTTTTTTEPPPPTTEPPPSPFAGMPPETLVQTPAARDSFFNDARIDAAAALGPAFWQTGVNGTAKPSLALTLTGGWSFGAPTSRVRFRMGALFGYTFLGANEDGSNVSFVSFLIDPTLDIRLTASGRMYLDFDFGLGVQALFGVKPGSRLLETGQDLRVNGGQSLVGIRLGGLFGYRLTPKLALFTPLATMNSPKKEHFYQPISRIEWLFGGQVRF